jgi:hypothetical protein
MLYTVFVAVCLAGTPVRDCDRHSAISWVAAPEQQHGLAACMIHGQEYAAQAPGLIREGTYVKVYCVAPTSIGKENVG